MILGLAGGSVARVARALLPGAKLVGVEKDRDVLDVAFREFGLAKLEVEIVEDDAFHYLRRERRRFDAVIEDLMVGTSRTVRKPAGLLERYDLVTRRVARDGVLVVNTIHETPRVARILARGPGTLLRIGVDGYYNRILAIGPPALRASAFRARLAAHPVLSASLATLTLRTLRL